MLRFCLTLVGFKPNFSKKIYYVILTMLTSIKNMY